MSKFVRRNNPPSGVMSQQRLFGTQVAIGEPIQLAGNTEFRRDVESSLEIIAQERLREVEAQAKSLIVRAREESAKILEQANSQAKTLLVQTRGEVEGIRENAHEEGFKAGYAEGYTDATAQVTEETRQMLEGAQTLVEGAYLAEQRVMKHFESQTVKLIRHVVRQILNREMSDSPETAMRMIQQAIASLYVSGKVQVVVSAQVIHELRDYATATEQALSAMSRFEFIADPVLERNQIYIISQEGCFDLSPDTQLDHLLTALEPHLSLPRDLSPDLSTTLSSADSVQPDESDANSVPTAFPSPEPAEATDKQSLITPDSEFSDSIVWVESLPNSDEPNLPDQLSEPQTEPQTGLQSVNLELSLQLAQTVEPDPVAWEEFPVEAQTMDGFPALLNPEPETADTDPISESPFPAADDETLP